jgi:benzodiazapine receptor
MSSVTYPRSPRSWIVLIGFLLVVLGVGSLIGIVTAPGEWYASLEKPPFNPPSWLFAPVWTTLYILIAIAGWRTFERDARSSEMALWIGQMLLNWLWSPLFFVLHWLWPAVAVIVVLLALILTFIARTWRHDRVSAWLFVPYAAWVCFATLLNVSLALLN